MDKIDKQEELAMLASMHQEVIDAIKESKLSTESVLEAIKGVKIEVPKIETPIIPEIKIPEIKIPNIKIPKIELPTINVPEPKVTVNIPKIDTPIIPEIKIPEIIMPDSMNVTGNVGIIGDINNPLPVQLRDMNGKPVSLEVLVSGGGSGTKIVKVSKVDGTVIVDGSAVTQPVSGTLSATQSGTWTVGESNSFINVTGATTSTVIKSGAGVLHTVTINKKGTTSIAALYADLVGEGSKIAEIDTTLSTNDFLYDVAFTSGLVLVTTGAAGADLTVSYK